MLIDERKAVRRGAFDPLRDPASEAAAYLGEVEGLLLRPSTDLAREVFELLGDLAADESLSEGQRDLIEKARARGNALWVKAR